MQLLIIAVLCMGIVSGKYLFNSECPKNLDIKFNFDLKAVSIQTFFYFINDRRFFVCLNRFSTLECGTKLNGTINHLQKMLTVLTPTTANVMQPQLMS
jgi:hypothetical protein